MHLHFLGTGNTTLPRGRASSLLVIEDHIMIDCPPDCLKQLRDADIDPDSITAIVFTHWHGDHCAGFPMFALERQRTKAPPLHVYGPGPGKRILTAHCQMHYPGFLTYWCRNQMRYHNEPRGFIRDTNLQFECFPVKHFGDSVRASGYLLRQGKLTVMHTGDSGPCDAIASRIPQCQVVIIEMGLDRASDFHFCPEDIKILAATFPSITFLVTHTFCAVGEEPDLGPNVRHMQDGQEWKI